MFSPLTRRAIHGTVRAFLAFCTLVATGLAHGQALDSVEIVTRDDQTELIVHFLPRVQYLRHAPVDYGKSVRVYLQFVGPGVEARDYFVPVTKHLAKTEHSPHVTISYPEPDKSLLIIFDAPARYIVRPGKDGRSISILLIAAPKG